MAKILLLNPNKWGRGITTIWVTSHAAVLRSRGHEVRLFDATFYRDWAEDEIGFNTRNEQYRPTDYEERVSWNENSVRDDLQRILNDFQPDVVFWSALSSHIHGEGEYVNIQYGSELMAGMRTDARLICGGLQPTAAPVETFARFPALDFLIGGESEFVLPKIAEGGDPASIEGLVWKRDGAIVVNPRQPIISTLDDVPPYDFSLFDDQVFLRAYNGAVVRAVDYEMSRGCMYACSYCVETVIQRYYGFTQQTSRGAIINAKGYLRSKSAARILQELAELHERFGVELVRCQDTNFMTIERSVLLGLADLMDTADLPIRLYIETRPEGINVSTIPLLKRLKVDGIGMGIELSTQAFREKNLNRFADEAKIVAAFRLLKEAGIRRTAYNIIGLAGQDESSIIETIEFNRFLDPDNVTVAFYSPYLGTGQHVQSAKDAYFNDYEYGVDSQLRTRSRHLAMTPKLLAFYKANFSRLVRNGFDDLAARKREAGL